MVRYLTYALGEVLLVIIGILIAVNLNNANERRKEQRDIDNLLRQVQSELETNIQFTNIFYAQYNYKDSLIREYHYSVLPNQKIESGDFGHYISMIYNYYSFNIQSDSYEALMTKAEFIPASYDQIMENLKFIHIQKKSTIDSFFGMLKETINEELHYAAETQSWYANYLFKSEFSSEFEKFLLTDLRFINKTTDYINLATGNLLENVLSVKERAIDTYRLIDKELEASKAARDESPNFSYELEHFASWIGDYRDPTDSDTIRIVEQDGLLRMLWGGNDFDLYPVTNSLFNINYPHYTRMTYNTDGSIKGFIGHRQGGTFEYQRINP